MFLELYFILNDKQDLKGNYHPVNNQILTVLVIVCKILTTDKGNEVAQTDKDVFADWLTTAQAAEVLGLTQRRIRQLIDEGELEGYKVSPKLWMVKATSVEEYQQKKK